jgi:hypothetical protein
MSQSRIKKTPSVIFSTKSTTGIGNIIEVSDYRHLVIVLSSQGTANGTVKLAGSYEQSLSDVSFSSSASATNLWDFVAMYNLQNPSSIIPGDTGVVYSGTDAVEHLLVNVDGIKYLTLNITAISAGSFNAKIVGFTNL